MIFNNWLRIQTYSIELGSEAVRRAAFEPRNINKKQGLRQAEQKTLPTTSSFEPNCLGRETHDSKQKTHYRCRQRGFKKLQAERTGRQLNFLSPASRAGKLECGDFSTHRRM